MTTTTVRTGARTWLERNSLIDDGVDLDRVKLKVGGPIGLYLKLVGRSAMTIGNTIWFVSEAKRDDNTLVAHELVHVGQYHELGIPRFLVRYFRDLTRAGFRYSKQLPLEAPAYARQDLARSLPRDDEPLNV